MKRLGSHLKFNKQERSGIFFLLLAIVLLQLAAVAYTWVGAGGEPGSFALDRQTQEHIDALKKKAGPGDTFKVYPFNPNYITDYKGYVLGMSVAEIDRLHEHRAKGHFINSVAEFQKVTQVSDSLLDLISPYFEFPEWLAGKDKKAKGEGGFLRSEKTPVVVRDINKATAEELMEIRGIGERLSARIVKFRDRLGGFLVDGQVYDVYGLDVEVANRVLDRFKVLEPPRVDKININEASVEEIAGLVYIRWQVAERIVAYRENTGPITAMDELRNIEGFPSDKIDRIALYLSL
ncbi:ComEA family DNA-binding protein [Pseudozobellia thermophila]|uniref:Competence protein ComEA helix-hairpin-helix repeat region n=1 Tax=Pseudozobellia thermophila TaxID=192903 RepID=A0A1M6K056_9FLAO|nr:helix-hairpin-helix domain-containing protein [Pseudozobellia thermophila]SHJ52319.1 competence protein ComEA helix-hairpin-helix repeat region [Pseudozobellia thermophila]